MLYVGSSASGRTTTSWFVHTGVWFVHCYCLVHAPMKVTMRLQSELRQSVVKFILQYGAKLAREKTASRNVCMLANIP